MAKTAAEKQDLAEKQSRLTCKIKKKQIFSPLLLDFLAYSLRKSPKTAQKWQTVQDLLLTKSEEQMKQFCWRTVGERTGRKGFWEGERNFIFKKLGAEFL